MWWWFVYRSSPKCWTCGTACPQGLTGPQGPAGPQGPPGTGFVQNYTYSTASLEGTYTLSMAAGDAGSIVSPISFLGSLVLDGNGNITGTLIEAATPYGGSTVNCTVSVTGSYSLNSSATGNANISLTGAIVSASASPAAGPIGGGNNCWAVPPMFQWSIMAGQQGQVLAFQMAAGDTSNFNFSGFGLKQ